MKTWQIWWLRILIIGSVLHLIRDVLQELKIHTFLSDVFVKPIEQKPTGLLWSPYNTVIIEVFLICLAIHLLRRNRFGNLGKVSLLVPIATLVAFLYYWSVS
jgi:hypothetical protein